MAESLSVGFRLEEPYARELLALTQRLRDKSKQLGNQEESHHQVAKSILVQALNQGEVPSAQGNDFDSGELANLIVDKLTKAIPPPVNESRIASAISDRVGSILERQKPQTDRQTLDFLADFVNRTFAEEKQTRATIEKLRGDILRLVDFLDKYVP